MKNAIIAVVIILILAGAGLYFLKPGMFNNEVAVTNTTPTPVTPVPVVTPPAPITPTTPVENKDQTVLGTSVGGRNITAYHFGTGVKELLFIGGAHGGYEWNTSLVAFQLMDYLKTNPSKIPSGVRVTVIPVLNPDGLFKVTGKEGVFTAADIPADANTVPGRYNANNVDLNRNFDCDWKATGTWQNTKVSGGSAPFSEPESKALQAYVTAHTPTAVVEWFSSAGGVYSSSCGNGISSETSAITKVYADASGYPSHKNYDFYNVTGDMVNWFAKNNIPAISVLLTDHTSTEWTKNQAGVDALLVHYTK